MPPTVFKGRHTLRRHLAALTVGLLATAVLVTTASAHAILVKSAPTHKEVLAELPPQVTLWFSQELDTQSSRLRVFDGNGRQIDNGDGGVDLNDLDHASLVVSLPSSLAAGTYTIHWQAVSVADGDATAGAFAFGVGAGTVVTEPLPLPSDQPFPVGWLIGAGIISVAVMIWGLRHFSPHRQPARLRHNRTSKHSHT